MVFFIAKKYWYIWNTEMYAGLLFRTCIPLLYTILRMKVNKRSLIMIEITKEEAMKLRGLFPDLRLTMTNKKKARAKTYYCPEERHYMKKLAEMRRGK